MVSSNNPKVLSFLCFRLTTIPGGDLINKWEKLGGGGVLRGNDTDMRTYFVVNTIQRVVFIREC